MSFIDSYKRLEKLCGEIYGIDHGLSAYIDEMTGTSSGSFRVPGWNEDLKQLKHYRWIRNQIVHEPGRTEENMCTPRDTQWLDDFHSRIMSVSDPLALYRRAKEPRNVKKSSQTHSPKPAAYTYPGKSVNRGRHPQRSAGYPAFILCILIVLFLIIVFAAVIYYGKYDLNRIMQYFWNIIGAKIPFDPTS